ncbi:MAG: hypothetical protein ACYDG2_08755 [Ruminiclostridium sp.]
MTTLKALMWKLVKFLNDTVKIRPRDFVSLSLISYVRKELTIVVSISAEAAE